MAIIHLGQTLPYCLGATYPDDISKTETAVSEDAAAIPIRSCSRWGLPCQRCRQRRGGLLPHPFTLTQASSQARLGRGGLLSVALSLRSPSPAVNRHRVSVEPGLSSTRANAAPRPPSRLTGLNLGGRLVLHNPLAVASLPAKPRTLHRTRRPSSQSGSGVETLA